MFPCKAINQLDKSNRGEYRLPKSFTTVSTVSKKFNNQFSKNILENGAKNYMQGIYMGYMYHRWKKIREKSIP